MTDNLIDLEVAHSKEIQEIVCLATTVVLLYRLALHLNSVCRGLVGAWLASHPTH